MTKETVFYEVTITKKKKHCLGINLTRKVQGLGEEQF